MLLPNKVIQLQMCVLNFSDRLKNVPKYKICGVFNMLVSISQQNVLKKTYFKVR